MTGATPLLFPDAAGAGPAPRQDPHASGRRGWSALPLRERIVELDGPSVVGRRRLTFRYRPLKNWLAPAIRPRLDAIESLLVEYFRHFGGFRLVDQAVMRAWMDGPFTPEEYRWALRAKWRSLQSPDPDERREKRRFIPTPAAFPRVAGYWLERAPEHQQQLSRRQDDALREKLSELGARRAAAAAACSASQSSGLQSSACAAAARMAYWEALSDTQRTAARKAVEGRFRERLHTWGENPDDPRHDGLLRDMAINWARLHWPPAATPTEEYSE